MNKIKDFFLWLLKTIKGIFTGAYKVIAFIIAFAVVIAIIIFSVAVGIIEGIRKKQIKDNKEVINENQDYIKYLHGLLDKLKLKK